VLEEEQCFRMVEKQKEVKCGGTARPAENFWIAIYPI